jgi:hypothetical protein
VDISALDPNVKHCILVKKRQSSPTTNPTTTTDPSVTTTTATATTTYSTTTTYSNTTSSPDDGIQYEYELVDCNGSLEAYRLCYKEPLNCSEASPGTNRKKRAAVIDTVKDNPKHKASHGELP